MLKNRKKKNRLDKEAYMKNPNWTEPTLEEIIQEYVYKHLEKRSEHFFYLYEGYEEAAERYDFSQVDVDEALEPFKTQLECILLLAREAVIRAKNNHKQKLKSKDKKDKQRLANTIKAFNKTEKINPRLMYLPKAPEYAKLKGKKHPKSVQLSGKIEH